jgi:hypothetical protein
VHSPTCTAAMIHRPVFESMRAAPQSRRSAPPVPRHSGDFVMDAHSIRNNHGLPVRNRKVSRPVIIRCGDVHRDAMIHQPLSDRTSSNARAASKRTDRRNNMKFFNSARPLEQCFAEPQINRCRKWLPVYLCLVLWSSSKSERAVASGATVIKEVSVPLHRINTRLASQNPRPRGCSYIHHRQGLLPRYESTQH